MRSIVRWCLDRRSVVILATVLVLVGGLVGATKLRQQLFPDFDFPFAIITMDAPGYDARTLDELVAQPVDRAVSGVDKVENVTTVASEGRLRIYAELDYGTDSSQAQRDIEDAIADTTLPDGVASPEFAGGFQDQAVVMATITTDSEDLAKVTEQANDLKAELEQVDGVGRVDLAGGSDPRILVELKSAAISAGVAPQQVVDAIAASGSRANVGVIATKQGGMGVVVTGSGAGADSDMLKTLLVPSAGKTVGELATVRSIDAADGGFAVVNGKAALTLSVFRKTGSDEVSTVDGTIDVLDKTDAKLDDASINALYQSADEIRASIKGLIVEGLLGALFAVIVIFLFLRTLRGTLVAAISIPTSVVFGLLAAWILGLSLNIITLAGLTIAIGRVIDDGIVVLENIHKHLERGAPRRRAMIDGTGEVAVAIASSTIATAAVFLPIGLVGGLISEIFLSFSIIVTVALLASLLVAVTLIPVVGSFVLKPSSTPHDPEQDALARAVVPATRIGIRWRWPVLGVAILSMVAVFGAVASGAIPTQFLPSEGASQVTGTVQLAPGTTAADAKNQLKPLDAKIGTLDGVKDVQVTYGIDSGAAAFDPSINTSTAEFFIVLKKGADGDKIERQLRSWGEQQYPDAFGVQVLDNGPPSGSFQVNVDGDDLEDIAKAATQVQDVLEKHAKRWDLVQIEAQAAQSVPQLVVKLKPGAPVDPVAVQAALKGTSTPLPVTQVGAATPITVGAEASVAGTQEALAKLPVATTTGAEVPLGQVATFETIDNPTFVNRVDGVLSGTITARMLGDDTAGTTADIKKAVEKLDLPKGVTLDWDQGDQAFVQEMFTDMGIAMLVAITLVFFVLVIFFGSLAHPFTILAPILFSFIGSFGALIVTGRALGLPAMIGQLLLIGIIVSNSILLVDATLRARREGMRRDDAILHAAKLRVRPVLMTAAATIAALTPLSLGVSGEGGIISKSLGTVVIGGLLVATLLTLVIVPAVYRIMDRDKDMTTEATDS